VFGGALAADPRIAEYQVRQTAEGAEIDLVGERGIDRAALEGALAARLAEAGLPAPSVRVSQVESLARNPVTGKLKRFVPLPRRAR
jgi:hypothetical protein